MLIFTPLAVLLQFAPAPELVQQATVGCWTLRGSERLAVKRLDRLRAGDVLVTPVGGSATVLIRATGARIRTSGGSRIRLAVGATMLLSGVAPKQLPPLDARLARGLPNGSDFGPMSGGLIARGLPSPGEPSGLWPLGTLRKPPTEVRWRRPAKCERVLVEFTDGAEHVAARFEAPAPDERAAMPEGALKPGTRYTWAVTGLGEGEREISATGWLRLLTPDERRGIEAAEAAERLESAKRRDDVSPLAALALDYEEVGLLEDALQAYSRIARRLPNDAGVEEAIARVARRLRGEEPESEEG